MAGRPKSMLTLSEAVKRAGIGRTAAQRYKKKAILDDHAVGEGRKARYYLTVVKELQRLRNEGLERRGVRTGLS